MTDTKTKRTSRGGRGGASARDDLRVYAEVKRRLLAGHYPWGEKIVVEELAAEHGISRQPVYDALRRLSAEGFIEILPQVGCRVTLHELAEIRDFFRLFAAVEGASAELAATRISPDELAMLRRLNAQIGGLVSLADPDERVETYFLLNRELHSTIHSACGTPIVDTIGSGFYDRADFFINGASSVSPMAERISARHADHGLIIAALEAGDPVAARETSQEHIRAIIPMIEEAMGN
jgi:DNA-binding GntR family transcriptional regulator